MVGRMGGRSKKEWNCTICFSKYSKWQGVCDKCGKGGTLVETVLVAPKPKAKMPQKALNARSKRSERAIGKRMLNVEGQDPAWEKVATSTGRVGHMTHLQFDDVSLTYATENKNRMLPIWLIKAWIQIQQRGQDLGKNALLHLDPPNMPKTFSLNRNNYKCDTMAIIRQDRHEWLMTQEIVAREARNILISDDPDAEKLRKVTVILGAT